MGSPFVLGNTDGEARNRSRNILLLPSKIIVGRKFNEVL